MMSPLSQREALAAEIERHKIIAEAKVMMDRLGVLMNLMGDWAEEGWDHDAV